MKFKESVLCIGVVPLLICGLGSGPARSEPLMENLAALAVAARWCKDYTVDVESALKLALSSGKNPTKAPYAKPFEAAKEKLEGVMGDVGLNRFCTVTYERYKPGGPVPGFMVKN